MSSNRSASSTELILTRHGEAHCNLRMVAGGDLGCTGLTDRGHRQAELLAERLGREHRDGAPIDALYSGPRLRVRQTAAPIATALNLPVQLDARLSGPHHGEADGRPWPEIKAEFGGMPVDFPDRQFAVGSETWNEFLVRARGCLREIIDRHPGQRVLVVSHSETVGAGNQLLLRLPLTAPVVFRVGHTALTRWSLERRDDTESATLVVHNDRSHDVATPVDTGMPG